LPHTDLTRFPSVAEALAVERKLVQDLPESVTVT
jgi:hypothetical protein